MSYIGLAFLTNVSSGSPAHFQLPFLMGQKNGYQTWAGDYLILGFIKIHSGDSNVE